MRPEKSSMIANYYKKFSWSRDRRRKERVRKQIEKILSDSRPADPIDSDQIFQVLQARYRTRRNYKYDSYNAWARGVSRAVDILRAVEMLRRQGRSILEVGCGDGMVGTIIAQYDHKVMLMDKEDWRDPRARTLPFFQADLRDRLPCKENSFEFICSFNTFEHLLDPNFALNELVCMCKPGGCIYLEFGPLFWSPFGLHAFETISIPYLQILFSEQFFRNKLRQLGITDLGRQCQELQPCNQWKVQQFEQLWEGCGCEVAVVEKMTTDEGLHLVHEFPAAFRGRGLSYEDITVSAFRVILRT